MVSNFALERAIRYLKLFLLVVILVHLYQILHILFDIYSIATKKPKSLAEKFATIYDISKRGYNKKIPVHPVLYKLLIRRDYFPRQWTKKGRFRFSMVFCNMNSTIVGDYSTHTMCQVPFYPQLQRNTRNVYFIGGEQEDKLFTHNFQLLTGSFYNLTFVNNTELDVIVETQMGIKDLVSAGYKYGTTEMIKYDLHRPGQEQLVHSLTTPVEACVIFVALRAHPPEKVRKFVWEMNFSLYHVLYAPRYTPSGTFITFVRQSCIGKHNAQGPLLTTERRRRGRGGRGTKKRRHKKRGQR